MVMVMMEIIIIIIIVIIIVVKKQSILEGLNLRTEWIPKKKKANVILTMMIITKINATIVKTTHVKHHCDIH